GGMGGPATRRFRRETDGRTVFELLGTGSLAVVPPSLHSSGELRTWDEDGEDAVVEFGELYASLLALAAYLGAGAAGGRTHRKEVCAAPDDESGLPPVE